MSDLYAAAAEHFDLISAGSWRALGPSVAATLTDIGPASDGPVIDLGAGTGLGLKTIAKVLPKHEILAIEPSASLRIGLFGRLADDPALAERVTVLATTAEDLHLPARIGAVLGINMIGHLEPAARTALWARLGERLGPRAPVVVTLQPPSRPEWIPETLFGEARVGRLRYTAAGSAEPSGDHRVTWRITYRVHDGDMVLAEHVMQHQWWTVDESRLESELSAAGLRVRFPSAGLAVATRSHA